MNKHIIEAIELARGFGLQVLTNNRSDYFHFSDGKKIGYMQIEKYGKMNMSIKYKPSKANGTGASFFDETYYDKTKITEQMINCLEYNPVQITGGKEKYWADFNEYFNQYWDNKKEILEPVKNVKWVMKKDNVWLETIISNTTGENIEHYEELDFLVLNINEALELLSINEAKKYINEWVEINEDYYYEMLEILPPLKWRSEQESSFFFISEATASNIHALYCSYNDKYYTANRRLSVKYSDMLDEVKGLL